MAAPLQRAPQRWNRTSSLGKSGPLVVAVVLQRADATTCLVLQLEKNARGSGRFFLIAAVSALDGQSRLHPSAKPDKSTHSLVYFLPEQLLTAAVTEIHGVELV